MSNNKKEQIRLFDLYKKVLPEQKEDTELFVIDQLAKPYDDNYKMKPTHLWWVSDNTPPKTYFGNDYKITLKSEVVAAEKRIRRFIVKRQNEKQNKRTGYKIGISNIPLYSDKVFLHRLIKAMKHNHHIVRSLSLSFYKDGDKLNLKHPSFQQHAFLDQAEKRLIWLEIGPKQ